MVVAPRTSGSMTATLAGGGSGGSPRSRSITKATRGTRDVVVPLAVILRIKGGGRMPPILETGNLFSDVS
jgi:hypothetical protein